MEDLESPEFKVHDPCVSWLSGKDHHPRLTELTATFVISLETAAVQFKSSLNVQDGLRISLFDFSESEVALCTREGHVLSFSLSSNLTTTLLDNSSLVSYSAGRRSTDLSIDRLITTDSWTNCAAGGAGYFHTERDAGPQSPAPNNELVRQQFQLISPPIWLICVLST